MRMLPLLFLALTGTIIGAPRPAGHPQRVEKALIILVEFPDVRRQVSREFVADRFFTKLDAYVRQMSYNRVGISGDITRKWYRMPAPIARYRISSRNLEVDKSRVSQLLEDAINAADADVDFSQYTFTAIVMRAGVKDYGMIGLCGYPGMLGWQSGATLKSKSGQQVKGGIAIFCYQAHLGTLFHDTAHILGGVVDGKRMVPCLYDHDLQAKAGDMRLTFIDAIINLGFWDPMSCHYYQFDQPPPGLSAWTKLRLNWIDPAKVRLVRPGEQAEVLLGPLEDDSSATLVIKIPISPDRYYLIENRQAIGCDRVLPGHGVLIMKADDRVGECRRGRAPVRLIDANPRVPRLEGAAFDIGKKDSHVDPEHGFRIQLLEKAGNSYRIGISPFQS